MSGMKVSSYFSEFSIRLDRSSFKRADDEIDKLSAKLRKMGGTGFGFRIGKFDIDQAALKLALGNSLDLASKTTPFEISKFVVNDRNLQAALLRAARRLPPLPPNPPGGGPNPPHPPHPGPYPPYPPRPGPYPPDSRVRRSAFGGGLMGGGLSGLYAPALALGLGGYGLSELNQKNQQVVSAQLQSQAVVQQAGGTVQEGTQSFEWLKNQANRVGFNYLDASGDYNKLLSGLTGAGMSVEQGQGVFKGFSELSRVNKLDRVQQQRVFRALSQVAGKDKLQSEELVGQLSESLPGAVSLFAKAYQNKLAAEGKGGGKEGKEAITELLAAMKKGQVRGDILTYAGIEAGNRAAPGLDAAGKASQAEQARYQNSVNDLAVIASNAGVEEGFARIFRTLSAGLSESNGLVETLAESFNDATKWADDLLLWPQSFIRALQGKDSLVADWLGKDETAQLIADYNQIKAIWTELSAFKSTDIFGQEFLPTLQATTQEIKNLLDMFARLKGTKDQAKGIIQEEYQKDPSVLGNVKGVAKANWYTFSNVVDAINPMDMSTAKKTWGGWLGIDSWKTPDQSDTLSNFDTPDSEKQFKMDALKAAEDDVFRSKLLGFADYRTPTLTDAFAVTTGTPLENQMGLFANYRPLEDFKKSSLYQPAVDAAGNRSDWQPSNYSEQADWNLQVAQSNVDTPFKVKDDPEVMRQSAMGQSEQVVNNSNVVNNKFDIVLNVDATLAGIELETQAREMANSFSSALTTAFEQVQVNYPTKQ